MQTIVLFGVKGSGKDTIGDVLQDRHGFMKEAFAKLIKAMLKLAFGFSDEDLYGSSEARERFYTQYAMGNRCLHCDGELKPLNWTETLSPLICAQCGADYPPFINVRIGAQTLGTQWGRRLYQHLWVDRCFERIALHRERCTVRSFVITDGRFRNELKRSKVLGATCVKLTRGLAESTSQHQSEAEFRSIPDSEFDLVFDNANMTLAELPVKVEQLLLDIAGSTEKESPNGT